MGAARGGINFAHLYKQLKPRHAAHIAVIKRVRLLRQQFRDAEAHYRVQVTSLPAKSDAGLAALASRCPQLTYVDLSALIWRGITKKGLVKLLEGCPHLTDIEMWPGVTDDLVVQLAEGCPGLQRVGLFACTNITDKAVTALATGCSSLKHLNLYRCRVTNKGIAALTKGCPGLVELIVEGCDVSSSPAIDQLRAAGCRVYISITVRNIFTCIFPVVRTGL